MAIWVITRWYNLNHCRWPGHPRTAQSGLRPGRHGKIEPQGGYIPTCSYLVILIGISGTCLILCSFSWLKWFKSNYDILRVDSAHVWDIERVAQFWPTPQLVDGIWMEGLHNCQLTTAACNSRGESKNLFYCWHAAVPNTMRLVWTSYSVHPRSFTYAVPSGMPIFDSELVVELWEGFHFKLKGLESFGQRVTNWDLRHSETMHFSGSMMINDG